MHHRNDVAPNRETFDCLRLYPRLWDLAVVENDVVSFECLLQLEICGELPFACLIPPNVGTVKLNTPSRYVNILSNTRCRGARLGNLAYRGRMSAKCSSILEFYHKSRLTEDERSIFKINNDGITVVEDAFQHLDRQRIEDIPLECAPERTRTIDRIESAFY